MLAFDWFRKIRFDSIRAKMAFRSTVGIVYWNCRAKQFSLVFAALVSSLCFTGTARENKPA